MLFFLVFAEMGIFATPKGISDIGFGMSDINPKSEFTNPKWFWCGSSVGRAKD
jgi:hypothetical protein